MKLRSFVLIKAAVAAALVLSVIELSIVSAFAAKKSAANTKADIVKLADEFTAVLRENALIRSNRTEQLSQCEQKLSQIALSTPGGVRWKSKKFTEALSDSSWWAIGFGLIGGLVIDPFIPGTWEPSVHAGLRALSSYGLGALVSSFLWDLVLPDFNVKYPVGLVKVDTELEDIFFDRLKANGIAVPGYLAAPARRKLWVAAIAQGVPLEALESRQALLREIEVLDRRLMLRVTPQVSLRSELSGETFRLSVELSEIRKSLQVLPVRLGIGAAFVSPLKRFVVVLSKINALESYLSKSNEAQTYSSQFALKDELSKQLYQLAGPTLMGSIEIESFVGDGNGGTIELSVLSADIIGQVARAELSIQVRRGVLTKSRLFTLEFQTDVSAFSDAIRRNYDWTLMLRDEIQESIYELSIGHGVSGVSPVSKIEESELSSQGAFDQAKNRNR